MLLAAFQSFLHVDAAAACIMYHACGSFHKEWLLGGVGNVVHNILFLSFQMCIFA
jgi:hypothetical protein